jgi:pilus assembly protein Flp/PilA
MLSTQCLAAFLRLTPVRLFKNRRAQDLIEYALMAGFVAVAAGAAMPAVAGSIATIFSQVSSVLSSAASQS